MDEVCVERILGRDMSQGSESFRDALLCKCLEALGSHGVATLPDEESFGMELDDGYMDMLAAAGDQSALVRARSLGGYDISCE